MSAKQFFTQWINVRCTRSRAGVSEYIAHLPQIGQMPRDFWLRHTEQLLELAHATIPLRQQIQDAQPRLIREGLKKLIGFIHDPADGFLLPRTTQYGF